MAKPEIKITGIKELRQKLTAVEADLKTELKTAYKAAAEVVASDARGRVPVVSGNLKESIKATATVRSGRVSEGNPKTASYFGWIEFGGRRHGKSSTEGDAVRPYIKRGRFLYPALDAHKSEIETVFVTAIRNILNKRQLT